MFCANCGKELPEGTKFCGYCGAPTGAAKAEAKEVTEPEKETAEATAEVTKENVASATETAAASSEASAPAPEPKKKKGRGGLIAGIIAACVGIVAIVAGVIFFTGKNFEHTMHKTFDKPKDYYSYLEKKNIETLSEKMKSEPVQKVLDQMKQVDASFKETVKIKIGSKGKEYTALASAAGVDLSWLESVGISCDANVKDDCFSMNLSPILNDVNLFQLAFMMDVKGGMIYAALPDLSEKYFGVSLGDGYDYEMIKGEMSKVMDAYNEMMACYPDPETMQEIILKYYDLIMENVEEVAKEKATLEVGDISVSCTLIRIELDSKDVQKIVKAVLTEMKKDKDIEKMILNMYEALAKYGDDEELNGEKMYEEFQEGIDSAIENLDDIEIKSLVIENYVDKNGEIVGRNVTIKQEDQTATIKYADVTKGNDRAFECSAIIDDKSFSITGTGTEKDGKFDGEFVFSFDKKKYVNVVVEGYDEKAAEDGSLIGSFTIKPGKDADLSELIESVSDKFANSPAATLISALNPSLKITCDVTMDKHDVAISLLDGGSELITISFSGELGEAKKIAFPEDYIALSTEETPDEKVVADYLKSLDLDKVISALEKANLPSEWTSVLRQYKDYLPQLIESKLY